MTKIQSFVVARDNLQRTRFVEETLPDLDDGAVLLEIDRFAFTANNVTYAEMGDRMAYWQFFPAPQGWGCIPVWGFADVVASSHASIEIGERIYGFLPMATHVVLRPDRVGRASFVEASPHRAKLPAAYNLYLREAGDPAGVAENEDLQALLRPVFITSFLIDDLLADEDFFSAQRVLISSASSKAAFGLAHLLQKRRGIDVTGLTSAANLSFVQSLGCYDSVMAYGEIARLPQHPATVYVDFAGSVPLRKQVHEHLGDKLVFSSAVGLSHRGGPTSLADLPGARPVAFFAPDRLRKRAKDWGREGLDERLSEKWLAFLPVARKWLVVVQGSGPSAVERVYADALSGGIAPREGHVLKLV